MNKITLAFTLAAALFTQNLYAVELTAINEKKQTTAPEAYDHSTLIPRVEEYLSSFRTMESRFTQTTTGRHQIRSGRILISRPGKARWEYVDPIKTTLTINNGRMSYYDEELDQISYTSVPASPLEVLLREEVKLSGDIIITDLQHDETSVSITVTPTAEKNQFETLTMVFNKTPLQLTRLHREDANNRATTLYLSAPAFNAPLPNDLFSLKDKTKKNKRN
jgi:outer membrane lipoprotein-sorting protein